MMAPNKWSYDNADLEEILTGLFSKDAPESFRDSEKIVILDRIPNIFTSTSPSEIVTCKTSSGLVIKLLCKYFTIKSHQSYGHGGDHEYESLVYQRVLSPLTINYPKYYGTWSDSKKAQKILFLDYLENTIRISKVPTYIGEAAKWLAKFHLESHYNIEFKELAFLKKYDQDYYCRWADQIMEFTLDPIKKQYPWLPKLCENYKLNVHPLLTESLSVIHGEFYPANVLYSYTQKQIVPVDWESAAVGSGVIDLASLTENWGMNTEKECIDQYCRIVKEKPEDHFIKKLKLARIYWCLRWLCKSRSFMNRKNVYYDNLQEIGKQLKFI